MGVRRRTGQAFSSMPHVGKGIGLALAILAYTSPADASAPQCAPPRLLVPPGVDASREELRIVCNDGPKLDCSFTARVVFQNVTAEPIALDASWLPADPARAAEIVPAHATVTLVRTEALRFAERPEPVGTSRDLCGRPIPAPIFVRHMFLGEPAHRQTAFIDAVVPRPAVELVAPAELGLEVVVERDRVVVQGPRTGSLLRRGGAFLAVGPVFTPARDTRTGVTERVMLRAGYGIAQIPWVIESAALETDFRGVKIVPTLELALPLGDWHAFVSAGAGVTARVIERPAIGWRGLLTYQFLLLGFGATWDVFPELPTEERTQRTFYVQLSF